MANQPTKYKKFVATAATATLVASAIVPVASAASFTDVNADQAVHIDALVEQGIIKGYEDGTFKPNQSVTRGQVVKMLGKWVEAQGFAVPADWETKARFTDLAVTAKDKELLKYAAVVADAEVFNGSNGVLNAGGKITRENMALVLDRAYKAVFGASLVEVAEGKTNITVSDLALAKAEAREAIQAIRNLEISTVANFNPKGDVTRANFAKFLNVAIQTSGEVTTPETGEVKIASLKASAVNELTVEFNKAVDTEAAAFAVKKGTSETIKVSKVEWNDAKTVATLTVEHKFVDATYNLTVTGVAEEALTASVTTTKEVVTEIKFNNDKLVLTGKKDAKEEALEARITFEVYNQYGEIVTDTTSDSYYDRLKLKGIDTKTPEVTPAVTDVYFDTQNKGTIIAWVDKREKEGETGSISFTYEFGDVEIDVDQDIVLSDDMEAGSVAFEGVHSVNGYEFNAKNVEKYGKEIDTETKAQSEFYLLLSIKDQFGNPITAKNAETTYLKEGATSGDSILTNIANGLRVSVSEDEIFDLDERKMTVKNVDGKYYFAIPMEFSFTREGYVEQTGENTVSMRSKATGEVNESKISLTASGKIQSIGLSAPDKVVASQEKVKLPVTVLDASGQEITDVTILNKALKTERIDGKDYSAKLKVSGDKVNNGNVLFVKENGKVFLEFVSIENDDDKKSKDMDIEIEVLDTREESEITLKVQPKAYAATLVKVSGDATTNFKGMNFEVEIGDFVVEDQYGRVFDDLVTTGSDYKIVAKPLSGSVALRGETPVTSIVNKLDEEFEFNAGVKGTSVYEFELQSRDNSKDVIDGVRGKKITSKVSVTFRTVDETDFDSYKVTGESLVYGTGSTTNKTTVGATPDVAGVDFYQDKDSEAKIKVYGVTTSGKQVLLPVTEYTVLAKDKLVNATGTINALKPADKQETTLDTARVAITQEGLNKLQEDKVDAFDTGVRVVINRTGEEVAHAITISDSDRKIASISLKDAASASGEVLEDLDVVFTSTVSAQEIAQALTTDATIKFKDQYGYEVKGATALADVATQYEAVKYTISDISSANDKYVVEKNGRPDVKVDGLNDGDTFTLTLKVDNATAIVKVRVIKADAN